MRKTLTNILGGAILTASSLASFGCTPGDLIGLGRVIGDGENADKATRAYEKRTEAMAGQGGQNNNVPQPQYQREPVKEEDQDFIFSCTGWEDRDGDGSLGLNEFEGFKQTEFKTGETVEFCIYRTAKRGDLRFVMKDRDGKIIKDVIDKDYKKGLVRVRDPPYALPTGKYTAEWHRDGVLLGKTEIEYKD
jgi:hypothetical protein